MTREELGRILFGSLEDIIPTIIVADEPLPVVYVDDDTYEALMAEDED